ncbi:hypothetical protein [uncultured Alsobacter sp.]|uniref:hypothetical protein n=1 Tax=uncultured Alsobacter sp. TaxID=1748258 RepID=UPI0025E765E5|nr:hypothetical protein [uncultured Alsobacter sp.]
MTEDEILADYAALRTLVTNVIGFHELAENDYPNNSLDQLKANAYVYADGHVLARRVFSLSQRLDEWGEYRDIADALRPLRSLCAEIFGANAWVDDEAAPEVERLMCHAQAYSKGVELAVRIMRVHDDLKGKA